MPAIFAIGFVSGFLIGAFSILILQAINPRRK